MHMYIRLASGIVASTFLSITDVLTPQANPNPNPNPKPHLAGLTLTLTVTPSCRVHMPALESSLLLLSYSCTRWSLRHRASLWRPIYIYIYV